ncbi:MAG: tetratricopeptide repeat protein, partial [Candidatus Omnitrophota bacterium]|nr:tetratricopeptide repeat protein [Candidatus Omnitrophota bacterium]
MRKVLVITALIFLLAAADTAGAKSVSREVKKAGRLYDEGKYDEAIENYDKALEIRPDDAKIWYNKAVTLYRKAGFSDAEDAFLRTLATGEEDLEKKSIYNAGNSSFRVAEALEHIDPRSALKNYNEAVQYYKKAMEFSPDDLDAKYNYEFTLKKVHDLEKEQQQKQDQQQKDQQEQDQQQKDQQKQDQQQKDQQKQDQQQKDQQQQDQQQKDQQKQDQQQKDQQE